MAQYNKANYKALYGTSGSVFPDNTTEDISEGDMRTFGENTSDSTVNSVDDLQKKVTATGTDTYAITGGIAAYADGFMVVTKFSNASTGAVTLNVNGLGAKKIMTTPTTQAGSGDITQNRTYFLVYDSALDSAAGAFLIVGGGGINSIDGGTI